MNRKGKYKMTSRAYAYAIAKERNNRHLPACSTAYVAEHRTMNLVFFLSANDICICNSPAWVSVAVLLVFLCDHTVEILSGVGTVHTKVQVTNAEPGRFG